MRKSFAAFMLVLLLSGWGAAQTANMGVVANIEFAFYTPEGKLLPAGTYEYTLNQGTGEDTLFVTNTKTRQRTVVPVLTTISNRTPNGEVVFDRSAEKYFLSEVFIPGMDGLLVKGASGKHTHTSVKAK